MKLLKKHPSITFYSLIIITFTLIYYTSWKINPDSFIKNNTLNSTPIHDAINLAYAYNEVKNENPEKLPREAFSEKISLSTNNFNKLKIQNLELEKLLSAHEQNVKLIDVRLMSAWSVNTQKYVTDKVKPLQDILSRKQYERTAISNIKNESNETQVNILLADKDVEISQVNLELATIERDASVYILANLAEFHDQSIVKELNSANKEIDKIRGSIIKNEKEMMELRREAQSMLNNFKSDDLEFWDFLFYSIGISTTTTFGDLLANSRVIRTFVCIQLLLSIIVLANVTQKFLSKK